MPIDQVWPAAVAITLLTVVHMTAGKLRFLEALPRSRWLSVAGGVSVAYVFIHLLPELGKRQQEVESESRLDGVTVYGVALAGLVIYYALERVVRRSRGGDGGDDEAHVETDGAFWLHVVSFTLYNAVIGYTLLGQEGSLLWFTVAMALHFVVTDHGLRQHHPGAYDRAGRWIVSAGIAAGFGAALFIELPFLLTTMLLAALAGAIILNVMKEELPEERQSSIVPFVSGAAVYTLLLLLT